VALNTLISGKRKKMRRIITEPYTTDSENYPIQNMGSDDDYQLLQQAISLLKEIDKAVVILHLEGYGNKEISRILCLSETNISTRLNRIKKHLSLTFKSGQHEPRKF
jgi:RNA polymerase sigma-70 factor (ECF subfamily)